MFLTVTTLSALVSHLISFYIIVLSTFLTKTLPTTGWFLPADRSQPKLRLRPRARSGWLLPAETLRQILTHTLRSHPRHRLKIQVGSCQPFKHLCSTTSCNPRQYHYYYNSARCPPVQLTKFCSKTTTAILFSVTLNCVLYLGKRSEAQRKPSSL